MQTTDPLIYRGMTSNQLAEAYDDTLSIPNFYALLSENREQARIIREKLNHTFKYILRQGDFFWTSIN